MTYPYGVHAAVVEVDTGTGQVRVLRYLVAYEVGRAINPMLVEGQLRGGVAQGIGGALFEEFGYDEAGQPQAITFIEYRLPTAAEIPPVDVLLSQDAPSPGNPLGVMGAGEGGINAVGATVANAVRDALGLAGGVGQLPLTPARVCALAALAQANRRPSHWRQGMTTEVPGYVSKTDLVAALIRELVITGELAPGEQLRQRDLAQRFRRQPDPGPRGDAAAGIRGAAGLRHPPGLHGGGARPGPGRGELPDPRGAGVPGRVAGRAQDRPPRAGPAPRAERPDARARRRRPGLRGAEPGVPLHGVLLRRQPAAAVADAAALGLAARRPPGVTHARRVRPPARRNPGRADRRRRRRRLGSDISAHYGRGSGKRSIREGRAARPGEPPCQRS